MRRNIPIICSACDKKLEQYDANCIAKGNQCTIKERWDKQQLRYREYPHRYCGLVGGNASGKTYYLLSLIAELTNPTDKELMRLMNNYNLRFEFENNESQKYFQNLQSEARLNARLAATNRSNIFANPIDLLVNVANEKYILTLFNSSGEQIENAGVTEFEKMHEISRVQAMIYLIDPRADSNLNLLLGDDGSEYQADSPIIREVAVSIKGNRTKASIPAAFCVSKFDLLERNNLIEFSNPYIDNFELNADFNDYDIQRIEKKSILIKNFLKRSASVTAHPDNIKNYFSNTKYFATSAIGHNKIESVKKKEPKGIMAPFFWILRELEIIKLDQEN